MALACEDSRMSMDSDLSNLSPCKPVVVVNKNNNKTSPSTTSSVVSLCSPERRTVVSTEVSVHRTAAAEDQQKKRTPSAEAVAKQTDAGRTSWFEIVEKEENLNTPDKQNRSKVTDKAAELVGSDTKMSMDDSNSNTSLRSSGSNRQIEIDILDSVNVQKYEKLDEKIKSPFKRRLSGDDDDDNDHASNEPDFTGGHAKFVDPELGTDGSSCTNLHKKTKMNEDDHGRERFRRASSSSSGDGSSQSSRKPIEYEKDVAVLERRQKQIDYGKNTLGYENYIREVPRHERTKDHPKTPPKHIKYSRRAWDGLIKVWRKELHCFDPNSKPEDA